MKRLIVLANLFLCASTAQAWQPAANSMLTTWGEKVTVDNAWREYPRPALAREAWTNLNGLWKFQIAPESQTAAPVAWAGDILVPYAIESALSGVKRHVQPNEALWYRRDFEAPAVGADQRLLLNFEAVDYKCTVWVNEKEVGTHTGGNLPFSFDITAAIKPGKNQLTVRVTDATDSEGAYQLHGKQVRTPHGIWYTSVTGIWQTVWLETVPAVHITEANITPSISGKVIIALSVAGQPTAEASVSASLNGKEVATATGPADKLAITIPNPKLWSPDSPTLYDLSFKVGGDTAKSYVGLRETTIVKDGEGHLRLALNGKPLFHFGTLDQGWWPDGLLTPPSDAAMCSDVEFLKSAGFNALRKHIKVEPRRYYTHCDRIGMLVWQDQVSQGTGRERGEGKSSAVWTRLRPNPTDATWPDSAHRQYMGELKIMIDTLRSHPCIVLWTPFNEAWGQHRSVEVGKWAVAYDPTRPINIASGGNFYPVGQIVDNHQYPHPGFPFQLDVDGRFDGFVKVVGEFGGHGFPVTGHLWNAKSGNWGYGGLPKDKEEWLQRYKTSIAKLAELKKRGIAAGIYTQTTDVENEVNGLITYDRRVQKVPAQTLAEIHRQAGLIP
jgi:beta-galactosidase